MTPSETPSGRRQRFADLATAHHLRYHFFHDWLGQERCFVEVGSVKRMIFHLTRLRNAVERVAKSKTDPWVQGFRGGFRLSDDSKELWRAIRTTNEDSPAYLTEGRRLNPWLKLGLHLAYKWGPQLWPYTNGDNLLDGSHAPTRRIWSRLVRMIRRICNTKQFRDRVRRERRNAEDLYQDCALYALSVFALHARPLFMRVDLYFEGDGKLLSESEEARLAFDKFMRALASGGIVADVWMYVAKREDGLERRIHYHILVAVDGDKHWNAYELGESLGRFWVDECVGSSVLGSFFNVWVRRNELEYNCMGHLHYTDESMLEGLRRALWYMCKPGAHVLVREGMGKNLRKGQFDREAAVKVRRGRPRKDGGDLTAAVRILLNPSTPTYERLVLPDPVCGPASPRVGADFVGPQPVGVSHGLQS